jgi:adenylate cyclase
MAQSDIVPLHRLIKRREAAALLDELQALVPGVDVAVIGGDGRPFVCTGEWCERELAEMLAQATEGETVQSADILLQPLLAESHLVGAVVARDKERDRVLRCLHRSLTLLLAHALEKRDIAREMLERYRELSLLHSIGETIGTCLDPEEIPRLVLMEASRVIRADVGMVLMPTADVETDLEVVESFGASGHVQDVYEARGQMLERVRGTGEPEIFADFAAGPISISAVLCAPLKGKEQVLGFILLGRLVGQPVFTAGDEKLLMALAGQAAVSVQNARLFASVKQQRDTIAAMKNYMDNILASIPSGIITTDIQNVITTFNRAAERIIEVRAEETMGQPYAEVLPELGREIAPLVTTVRRHDEQITGFELEPELPRRGRVALRVDISPLKDSRQTTTGVAIVLEDLTERRRLEQQVRQVRETFERYVAPRVVEQLLSDPESVRLGGVRRDVTILFADIRGSTAFGERAGPEIQIEVLNRHLTVAAEAVLEVEGTLDKFMGDSVMALFNAPLAQPDHVLRAVRAAVTMQQAIADLHEQVSPTERLSFGVGIATGPVVVGNIGSSTIHDYTAVGDSVNMAYRLQAHAQGGQILLSSAAQQSVSDRVVSRELGFVQFKGHSEPDLVFEVLGLRE